MLFVAVCDVMFHVACRLVCVSVVIRRRCSLCVACCEMCAMRCALFVVCFMCSSVSVVRCLLSGVSRCVLLVICVLFGGRCVFLLLVVCRPLRLFGRVLLFVLCCSLL